MQQTGKQDKKDEDEFHSISAFQDLTSNIHQIKGNDVDGSHIPLKERDANDCIIPVDENDDFEYGTSNWISRNIQKIDTKIKACLVRYQASLCRGMKFIFVIAYFTYFGYCMHYRFGDENSVILLVSTILVVTKLLWPKLCHYLPSLPLEWKIFFYTEKGKRVRFFLRHFLYLAATVGVCVFFGFSILQGNPQNAQSLLGILVFILICLIVSTAPGRVKWHPVFWGLMIQFGFAQLTLRTTTGYTIFKWLGDSVQRFIKFSDIGSEFVLTKDFRSMGQAFLMCGALIFFNSIISVLNHLGAIEFVILNLGMFLHYCLDTGPVESVIAAANIFVSLMEAPLLVRSYLPTISQSELNAIMTCGFASIAGGSLAVFIQFGAPTNHLLTATIISAPSALAFSKVLHPETRRVNYHDQKNVKIKDNRNKSILQACSEGALQAVPILVAGGANMLAFISVLGFIDAMLAWFGQRAGFDGITLEYISSYVLFPIAYVMGVPKEDCGKVGSLIGIKLFATPMVSYVVLGELIDNREAFEDYIETTNGTWHWSGQDVILLATNTTLKGGFMQVRSEVIATYAMCGFSAFTAIGVCLGTLIPICPERKEQIIQMVFRAFLGGNIASFATGSVAGMMYVGM